MCIISRLQKAQYRLKFLREVHHNYRRKDSFLYPFRLFFLVLSLTKKLKECNEPKLGGKPQEEHSLLQKWNGRVSYLCGDNGSHFLRRWEACVVVSWFATKFFALYERESEVAVYDLGHLRIRLPNSLRCHLTEEMNENQNGEYTCREQDWRGWNT